MLYQFPPDVEKLVSDRMASGNYETEDDLLREAIEAFENGDEGIPLDEAIAMIRAGAQARNTR